MDKSIYKRQLTRRIKRFISRLGSLGRAIFTWRLGHQLGLIISDDSLRICLVKSRLAGTRLVEATSYALDPDNTTDWMGKVEAAVTVLTRYLQDHNLKRIPINIGLLGEDIAFRRMYLPNMPVKELSAAIMWEGEKLFPFEFDQCSVDYQIVDRNMRNDIDHVGVNLIAVKNSIIESIYDRFRGAGLKVGQIGFLPAFIASLVSKPKSSDADEHDLLLYLSDNLSMAVFVHNGVPEFFQQFVTRPLVRPDDDATLANLEALVAELSSFLDLYNGQTSGNVINSIYLAGKYSEQVDSARYIGENIGLPCHPAAHDRTLLAGLSDLDQTQIAEYLDVIMTALVPPGDHPLAPRRIRAAEDRTRFIARVSAVSVLALIIAGGMHLQLLRQEELYKTDLDSKKAVVRLIENSPGYKGYINLIVKLDRSRAYLSKTQGRRASHFHILLKELSLILPEHINLSTVDLEVEEGKYVLRIGGNVRLTGFSPEILLADYVEVLGSSPFFDNVTVSNHHKTRHKDQFDLAFQLKMDAQV